MNSETQERPVHAIWLVARLFCGLAAVGLAVLDMVEVGAWFVALAGVFAFVTAPRRPSLGKEPKARRVSRVLIDGLTFGAAPALIVLHTYLEGEAWGWVVGGLFTIAALINVARSRVEPGPRATLTTQGLPAVVAGTLVASLYPFFGASTLGPLLGGFAGAQEVGGVMICFLILMVSPLPYPVLPRVRSDSGLGVKEFLLVTGVGTALAFPNHVIFPVLATYAVWGIAESVTPVLADGILEGEGSGATVDGEDARDQVRPYQARSTWE